MNLLQYIIFTYMTCNVPCNVSTPRYDGNLCLINYGNYQDMRTNSHCHLNRKMSFEKVFNAVYRANENNFSDMG